MRRFQRIPSTRLLSTQHLPNASLAAFTTPSPDAAPHLLLQNALALNLPSAMLEHYSKCKSKDLSLVRSQDLRTMLEKISLPFMDYMLPVQARRELGWEIKKELESRQESSDSVDASMIRLLGRQSLTAALGYFRSLSSNASMSVYESVISVLCAHDALEAALDFFNQLNSGDVSPTQSILMDLMTCAGRLGEPQKVLELYRMIEADDFDFKVTAESVLVTADAFARSGDVVTTRWLLNVLKVKELGWSASAYGAMIQGFVVQGNLGLAVQEYNKLRKRGLAPTTQILESLIRGHGKAKDVPGAVRYFYRGDILGLEPSLDMHLELIKAHFEIGEILPGWQRARQCLEFLNRNVPPESWIVPEPLSQLLAAHSKGKHVDFVVDHIKYSDYPAQMVPTFVAALMEAMVSSSSECSDPQLALALYDSFGPKGDLSDVTMSPESHAWAALAYLHTSQLGKSLELLEKHGQAMGRGWYTLNGSLISQYLSLNETAKAMEVYHQVQSASSPHHLSINSIEACLAHPKIEDAVKLEIAQNAFRHGFLATASSQPNMKRFFESIKSQKPTI